MGRSVHTDAKKFHFCNFKFNKISPSFDDNNNPVLGP